MDSIQSLQERRGKLLEQRKGLHELALKDQRSFTEDEQKEFDAWGNQADDLKAQIGRAETVAAEQADIQTSAGRQTFGSDLALGGDGATTNTNTIATQRFDVQPPNLGGDPFGGYAPREFARASDVDAQTQRLWFGAFAADVAAAAKTSAPPRLAKWQQTRLAAGDGMSGMIGHEGAYLLPSAFGAFIDTIALEAAVIRPRARRIPMATKSISWPAVDDTTHATTVFGGVQAYWKSEESALTSSKPSWKEVALELHKLTALAYVSGELLDWSPVSIGSWLPDKLAAAMAWKEDDGFISGSGAAGEPRGIINTPGIISIVIENGQAADTIDFRNIIKMDARIFDLTNRGSIVWIANRTCKVQLSQMTLTVGAGGIPVFLPPNAAVGRPWESLYGYPIVWTEHAETLGDAGDIVLCNVGEYLVGDASGKTRTDRDLGLQFLYDQTAFRVVTYSGGIMPWRAAFQPQHGNTLHPVIRIAERA